MKTVERTPSARKAALNSQTSPLEGLGWAPLEYAYDGVGIQITRSSKTESNEQDIYILNEEIPEFVRTVNEMWADFGEEITADNESRNPSVTVNCVATVQESGSNSPQVEIAVRGRGSLVIDLDRDADRVIRELMRIKHEDELIAEAHADDEAAEVAEAFEAELFHNEPADESDSDLPSTVNYPEQTAN